MATTNKINNTYVNGPINVIRLEGVINGIPKVLYTFMDYHEDIFKQTSCKDIFARNLKDFFRDHFVTLKHANKKIDMFIELEPDDDIEAKYVGRYIDEFDRLLKHTFKFNGHDMLTSNVFPNVRLHLIDNRGFTMGDSAERGFALLTFMGQIWNSKELDLKKLNMLTNQVVIIANIFLDLYYALYKSHYRKKYKKYNSGSDIFNKIFSDDSKINLDKVNILINEYNNKYLQCIILNILNNDIKDSFSKFFTIVNQILAEYPIIKERISIPYNKLVVHDMTEVNYGTRASDIRASINFFVEKIDLLHYYLLAKISSRLMDLHLIKRLLDTPNITNCIMYTGIDHAIHTIFVLTKFFNFKITHYSYLSNYNDLMTAINKKNKYGGIAKYFFPPILSQCSDLSDFPPMFD